MREGVEGFGVEVVDGGEAVAEGVVGGVERSAGDVVEDEVVEADVEGLGDAGEPVVLSRANLLGCAVHNVLAQCRREPM